MLIYLLTNKDTHARATVIARSEDAARCMRPDGRAVWDVRARWWRRYDHRSHRFVHEPPVDWWPEDPERIHVDAVGHAGGQWDVEQVLAFNPDPTPRQPGEGPDDSWGSNYDLFTSKAIR